jgi:DNA-binding transcriptional LysR family regulator
MKNLQGLIAFVEAAGAGSLAGAARRLDVTPAAVSKNLLKLEAQLGVRLFQRSTRQLRITPEGASFLDKARQALRGLDEAVAEVSQAAAEPAGRVRISVGLSFGRRWLLPALPALVAAHPKLRIEVDLDNRPVDLVAHEVDIAVRGGVIEDSSLVARRIAALPVVLLASPAYLRAHGVPQRVADLAAHRMLAVRYGNGAVPVWRFGAAGGRGGPVEVEPAAQLAVSDPEAVLDLALAGAGIAQAGLHHALPYLRSGRLKLLLPNLHQPGTREIVLHYPHRAYLAPRVRVVVDGLLAHFAQAADLHQMPAQVLRDHPAAAAVPDGGAAHQVPGKGPKAVRPAPKAAGAAARGRAASAAARKSR